MAGTDLYTLMRLGGWTSLRMVEKYASISADHSAMLHGELPDCPNLRR